MSAEVALELTHLEWSPACLLAQWVSDGNSGLTRLGSVRAAVEKCDRGHCLNGAQACTREGKAHHTSVFRLGRPPLQ